MLTPNVTDYYQICLRNQNSQPIFIWVKIETDINHKNPFDTLNNKALTSIEDKIEELEQQVLLLSQNKDFIVKRMKRNDDESSSLETTLVTVSMINLGIYGVLQFINYFITKLKLKKKKDHWMMFKLIILFKFA